MANDQGAKSKNMNVNLPSEAQMLDISQLGAMLRERRGDLSIRQAALQAGVSFSTLARVEGGAQPDLATFSQLCTWLGVSAGRFFSQVAERNESSIEEIVAQLKHDPRLTRDSASKLSSVLLEMYENLARRETKTLDAVACHLRATNVMRPGVPERLSSLLQDLHDGIARQVEQGSL